jgi:hypothetical protein
MRRTLAGVVIVGVLGLSGCTALFGGDSGEIPWGHPSGGAAFGEAPTEPVDVCALLPVSTMSALAGKTFTSSHNIDNPGYACAYRAGGAKVWYWDVSINDVGQKTSIGPDFRIGADGGSRPLDGVAYPAIVARDGVALQWGTSEVVVSDLSTYNDARGTRSEYVAVAEALMAAIHNSQG